MHSEDLGRLKFVLISVIKTALKNWELFCWRTLLFLQMYWDCLCDFNWKKLWLLHSYFLLPNKVKEASFKVLHWFYPTVSWKDSNLTLCNLTLVCFSVILALPLLLTTETPCLRLCKWFPIGLEIYFICSPSITQTLVNFWLIWFVFNSVPNFHIHKCKFLNWKLMQFHNHIHIVVPPENILNSVYFIYILSN